MSARDTRKRKGNMGIGEEKYGGPGRGKERGMCPWLVDTIHGFYEPAKMQSTRIAKKVQKDLKTPHLSPIPSASGQ